MKSIYKVSFPSATDGQFSSYIVCANDENQARHYHPDGVHITQATFDYRCPVWISPMRIDELIVEKIADVAHKDLKIGVIGHTFKDISTQ